MKKKLIIGIPIAFVAILAIFIFVKPEQNGLSKKNSNENLNFGDANILYSASNVLYDGTDSGILATTVQSAIQQIYDAIEIGCYMGFVGNHNAGSFGYGCIRYISSPIPSLDISSSNVKYDNSSSGLNSNSVQSAIDELASHVPYCSDGYLMNGDLDDSEYACYSNLVGDLCMLDASIDHIINAAVTLNGSDTATVSAYQLGYYNSSTSSFELKSEFLGFDEILTKSFKNTSYLNGIYNYIEINNIPPLAVDYAGANYSASLNNFRAGIYLIKVTSEPFGHVSMPVIMYIKESDENSCYGTNQISISIPSRYDQAVEPPDPPITPTPSPTPSPTPIPGGTSTPLPPPPGY